MRYGSAPQVYPTSPATWAAARGVASEFRAFTSEVGAGTALEVDVSGQGVQAAAWARDGRMLLLLVNTENAPATAAVDVPSAFQDATGTVLFGSGRSVALTGRRLAEPLEPFGVRALVFGAPPPPAAGNLLLNPSFELESALGFPTRTGSTHPARRAATAAAAARPSAARTATARRFSRRRRWRGAAGRRCAS